jgi:hypothetical protein
MATLSSLLFLPDFSWRVSWWSLIGKLVLPSLFWMFLFPC